MRQTSARSRESNSSTPCEVSITSGPDIARRPIVAHHDVVGAARDDAHAAEAAVGPADQHDDGDAGRAHVEQRAHHFGHRDQTGVGLVQAHAAGFGQQQHGGGPLAQRALQQADQLGAVHLADAAAHELAFLRGDEDRVAIERGAADGHAVVECAGHAELRQVRAGHPLGRRQPFVKAAGVEQQRRAARAPSIRQ